ncbi:CpsD/CapB family tyrosine-protein kinase [Limosilactobacillus vaginalis]|uniref:CpsD/CapB family tyrosine-protein kinase n=1 Tax=Limosilactobacillus vaginalis TaxID=1633 RepID=UPI00360DD996
MSLFKKKPTVSNETIKYGVKLITVKEPKSVIAEQFRTIRTNISFMGIDHPIKTLAFTSANISEGKSTVTDNIAVVWANAGKRVLLIDADLRRPTLHQTFNISNQQGLTTILTSDEAEMDITNMIKETEIDNLSILTSGPIPPNPAELLNSQRMQALIASMKDNYDVVVLDVPPILAVSDTQALVSHLDGVVLVIREGQTEKAGLKRSVELLKLAHANALGYVMNDVDRNGDAA